MRDSLLKKSVDVRIVNLYQSTVKGKRLFAENMQQYNVFAHYEKIEVQAVSESDPTGVDTDPLYEAYCVGAENGRRDPHQTLLAFIDIADKDEKDNIGYTRQEIDDFWKNTREPLLFLSMISLDAEQDYQEILRKVDDIFGNGLHLAYVTFDYCNVLIFSKGRSFQQCAEHMLQLDFESGLKIVDSITLFSFAHNFFECLKDRETEEFGAYLRIGISDMEKMNQFWEALQEQSSSEKYCINKNWIAGRHDIGILCQSATLNWLAMAWQSAKEFEGKWYTSFTLSIMIQPANILVKGKLPQQNDCSGLSFKMQEEFDAFREVYITRCRKAGNPEDKVWLRWLQEASQQAVALLENKMTCELGVSLVPQFQDFFAYAKCLWSKEELVLGPIWNEAENCFATMLTNTSILVDSMNHHSRQFISAPPVRTVAFEMPPKLMAYYTMILHKLIDVLRDDTNHQYGFTITPQFTRTLNVRSLTKKCFSLMGGDQFISIGISEQELYRMRHTTAVLAHEISHFVGCKGRKREIRNENILYVELYNIVLEITWLLCVELKKYYGIDEGIGRINEDMLPDMVKELKKRLISARPEYKEDRQCFMEDEKNKQRFIEEVKALLRVLPNRLYNTPELRRLLFECCWELLIGKEDQITELGMAVLEQERRRTGMPSEARRETLDLAGQRIVRLYQKTLQIYSSDYFYPADDNEPRWRQICDLFCEVYADLQAILLLQLDWKSYASLFAEGKGEEIPSAEWSRVLALAVALEGTAGWAQEDFEQDQFIVNLINKYKQRDRNGLISDQNDQIDIVAIDCLVSYLTHCRDELNEMFCAGNAQGISELRDLYNSLSDEQGFVEIVAKLSGAIQQYRKSLMLQV